KPVIERTLGSVATLFAQHVVGYVGSSVERRGHRAEQRAAWSMIELQDLLDEWVVTVWQNRPHDGLRDPLTPGKALSPNEKYAALVQAAGHVAVPLTADDYIELLPVTWRVINSYGVRLAHRTYDAKALNPYRRQHSGVDDHGGRWGVHHDPYDISRVWVRNHHHGGWISLTWTHLRTTPVPFGELAWQHARELLARRGQDAVTEAEIAHTAAELLDRAGKGPNTGTESGRRDRKVAGRTKATATNRSGPPRSHPAAAADETSTSSDNDTETSAKVIPMGIFDPFEEARKRW
ncbi:Mu transposase C-terminal domain-containing protein, partial [Nocardia vinacea]|uniref:Mu transposase C-terminal domain-containing protein n=1 Tax=Nocardia vinacea TaxID=96468 RepID=UPI0033C804E1